MSNTKEGRLQLIAIAVLMIVGMAIDSRSNYQIENPPPTISAHEQVKPVDPAIDMLNAFGLQDRIEAARAEAEQRGKTRGWIGFCSGLFLGGIAGIAIISLCVAARDADTDMESMKPRYRKDWR